MALLSLSGLKTFDTFPNTVRVLDFTDIYLTKITPASFRHTDCVVELRVSFAWGLATADFSFFPSLERLTFDGVPFGLTLPTHRLKCLRAHCKGIGPTPSPASRPSARSGSSLCIRR